MCTCICIHICIPMYRSSLVAETVKNPPAMWDTGVQSLGWEDLLEKGMATPVILSGKFHGQRSLVGYIHWVTKTWT